MLCHPFRCIYIHIPKAAGKSIHQFFAWKMGVYWNKGNHLLLNNNRDPAKGPPALSHLKASEFVRYGYVTPETFESYFKFSFVRNPWARIVSEYTFRGHPCRYDFKTWLFQHFPQPSWTDAYLHVIPQYDYLYDEKGNLLVDFVGKFENLRKDFAEICGRVGIPDGRLPHKNKNAIWSRIPRSTKDAKRIWREAFSAERRKNTFARYEDYYDDESREFVAELFLRDIETFGYEFGTSRHRESRLVSPA